MKKVTYSLMCVMILSASRLFSMANDQQIDGLALLVQQAAAQQQQAQDALYKQGARVASKLAQKKSHLEMAGVAGGGFVPQEQLLSQEDQRAYNYYLDQGGK
jgi:hypothetical protein